VSRIVFQYLQDAAASSISEVVEMMKHFLVLCSVLIAMASLAMGQNVHDSALGLHEKVFVPKPASGSRTPGAVSATSPRTKRAAGGVPDQLSKLERQTNKIATQPTANEKTTAMPGTAEAAEARNPPMKFSSSPQKTNSRQKINSRQATKRPSSTAGPGAGHVAR